MFNLNLVKEPRWKMYEKAKMAKIHYKKYIIIQIKNKLKIQMGGWI